MNQEILLAIIGIVAAAFGGQGFWTWLTSKGKKNRNEARLLMGIAYSKIIIQCDQYIKRGFVDSDEYNELYHYLYEPYKDMGGDGTVDRMMRLVEQLPTKKGEDYE